MTKHRSIFLGIGAAALLAALMPAVPAFAQDEDLVERAKAEGGTVVLYTGMTEAMPMFIEELHKTYPWMNIEVVGGTMGDLRTKFRTEIENNVPVADMVFTNLSNLELYRSIDAIAKVELPNDKMMPPDLVRYAPELHPLYQILYVMEYNTDAGITPPVDPYDLIKPEWKGMLALDRPSNAGDAATFLGSRRQLWGDEKWREWLAGLKANDVFLTGTAGITYSVVLQGERAIGIGGLQDILEQPEGAPVAPHFYQDVVSGQWYALISRLAPHPASAALFLDWFMSEDAQQVFAASGRVPARLIDSPMSVDRLLPEGIRVLPESTLTDWSENQAEYMAIFNEYWPE